MAAVIRFQVELAQICYDITSISFTGAYEQAELVRYGYSRDQRPDLKQVELALNVTAPDGVPINYQVLSGNTADRTTPVANLARLRALTACLPQVDPAHPPVVPLITSDRAMLTPESMAAYVAANVHFLGPCDAGEPGRALLQSVSPTVPSVPSMTTRGSRIRACSDHWSCRIPTPVSRRCAYRRSSSGARARRAWMPNCARRTSPGWRPG